MRVQEFQYVTFKETLTGRIRASLLVAETTNIIQSNCWKRSFRLKPNCLFSQLCAYIVEARCIRIQFLYHNYPNIIEAISVPFYSQLKQLKLPTNGIMNIEALAFINMPLVERMDLSQNNITCLKPLQKGKWANLKQINFPKNYIIQYDLNRTETQKRYFIMVIKNQSQNYPDKDLAKIVKNQLEGRLETQLSRGNYKHQKKLFQCMKRKGLF